MSGKAKKRAVVIMGAGASVELGIPTTVGFGKVIDADVAGDEWCQRTGGSQAYEDVKKALIEYYHGDAAEAHFERVYHVLHELDAFHRTPGAVPKFSPVMLPFLTPVMKQSRNALRAASRCMLESIYRETSKFCDAPKKPLDSMKNFFHQLEDRFVPRIYTTNYDDFVQQATGDSYFNGFTDDRGSFLRFSAPDYWANWDVPGIFHLHGSIHMAECLDFPSGPIGDIVWYPERSEAMKCISASNSGVSRMDGTTFQRGAILTGLDKLSRLQQLPFAFYYAGLSREVVEADLIIVIGSGLADGHLNTWINAARSQRPELPLLYIGYWHRQMATPGENADEMPDDFVGAIKGFDLEDRDIELFHQLHVDLTQVREQDVRAKDGWTMDPRGKSAVWSDGLQSCLAKSDALWSIVEATGAT
ncbi:SIR2 family protein [Pseudomonas sp. MWU13-2105]|uniref:SIR2 family protein n=1 Tax=Pseudomonas sp. MWU13-2105 TaxID=2935074 RepID=UPI00200E7FD9|nr:SIR2 family protein [Pseudomonas sp. MWU13-2105]